MDSAVWKAQVTACANEAQGAMASTAARHHADRTVGHHYLVALVDDVVDRRDDSSVPLTRWSEGGHFHFTVNGIADVGRSVHLYGRFQHGKAGVLHRGLNQEAFDETVAEGARHGAACDGTVLFAKSHVGEDHLDHTGRIDEIHQISLGDGTIDGAEFLADLEVSPEQSQADVVHAISQMPQQG